MGAGKPGTTAGTQPETLPEGGAVDSGVAPRKSLVRPRNGPRKRTDPAPEKKGKSTYQKGRKLSGRQETFVEALLSGKTMVDAALAAGYSDKSARSRASQLVRVPHVAEAIAAGRAKVYRKFELRAEQVIEELSKVGFHEEITPVKVRALELLGKHLQLFVDRVDMRVDAMKPEERAARAAALLETARRRLPGDDGADE